MQLEDKGSNECCWCKETSKTRIFSRNKTRINNTESVLQKASLSYFNYDTWLLCLVYSNVFLFYVLSTPTANWLIHLWIKPNNVRHKAAVLGNHRSENVQKHTVPPSRGREEEKAGLNPARSDFAPLPCAKRIVIELRPPQFNSSQTGSSTPPPHTPTPTTTLISRHLSHS